MSSNVPAFRQIPSDASASGARRATLAPEAARIERAVADSRMLRPADTLEPQWIAAIEAATD